MDQIELTSLNDHRLEALFEIETAINWPHELQAVLDRIVEVATNLLPATGGASICLWDEKTQEFTVSSSTIPNQEPQAVSNRVRKSKGATRWIIDNCKPLAVSDIRNDPFTPNKMLMEMGLKAYAGVPVMAEGKALGVLYALDRHIREYSEGDLNFLNSLANRAAVAVAKVQVYEQLRLTNQLLAERSREIERINRELRDFAHIISHDLKAPIFAVASLADWLKSDHGESLNSDGKAQLEQIRKRMELMKNLINGVLQYSSVGLVDVSAEKVDLNVLLPEIVEFVSPPRHIAISIQSSLPVLYINRTSIHQVFQNLISNAILHSDKDAGSVEIGCCELDDLFEFHVTDNGTGIQADQLHKIFKLFYSAPNDPAHRKGTGLGLAIVKKIIEMHGGEITCKSTPGQGAAFYFTIPKDPGMMKGNPTQGDT